MDSHMVAVKWNVEYSGISLEDDMQGTVGSIYELEMTKIYPADDCSKFIHEQTVFV